MTMFVIQSAILIAIAFTFGAVAGCLAWRMLAGRPVPAQLSLPARAPAPALPPPAPVAAPAPAVPESQPPSAPRRRKPAPKIRASAGPAAPAPAAPDDLKKIRGIGRQSEQKLNAAGIVSFAQIAAWTGQDQKAWGEKLAFPGRIERENWVSQATALAGGGETEFSKRVARGEVPSSAGPGGDAAARPAGRRTPRRK